MHKVKQKSKIKFYILSFLVNIVGLFSYFVIHEAVYALMVLLCGGNIIGIAPTFTNAIICSVDSSKLFFISSISTLTPILLALVLLFIKRQHADAFAYGISIACTIDSFLSLISIFWGIDESSLYLFDFAMAFKYSNMPALTLIVFIILFLFGTFLCSIAYERFVCSLERGVTK